MIRATVDEAAGAFVRDGLASVPAAWSSPRGSICKVAAATERQLAKRRQAERKSVGRFQAIGGILQSLTHLFLEGDDAPATVWVRNGNVRSTRVRFAGPRFLLNQFDTIVRPSVVPAYVDQRPDALRIRPIG